MYGNNSPGALHHELHSKPTDDKKREARRKNPKGNKDYPEYGSQNNRATAAPFLRQMANHCSAANCANSVNNPSRGHMCDAIVALFTVQSLIHTLAHMCHCLERHH